MRMHKINEKILIIYFFCIIISPFTLTVLGDWGQKNFDINLEDNSGVLHAYPKFSFKKYEDRSFQNEFENAWNSDFALHGILTRTYNQIRFSAFKTNHPANREYIGTDLIVGKNKNIFEYQYIAEYLLLDQFNGFDTEESKAQMDCYVNLLEEVSDKLALFNKKVIFLTTPNKSAYAYEDIPDHFRYGDIGTRAIDVFEYAVEDSGINYVSGRKIADENKESFPIFYRSGVHWSRPIEQIVCSEVIKKFGEKNKYVTLGDLHESSVPYWRDADVWNLLNIWESSHEIYYQYDETLILPEQYENRRILIQGGSFAEGLRNILINNHISPSVQYINYDNALINGNGNVETINHDWNNLNLQRLLDTTDIIIIEMNENRVGAYAYSNGFVEYLNTFLDSYIPIRQEGPVNLDFKDDYYSNQYNLCGIYPYENNAYAWSGKYTYIQLTNPLIAQKGLEIDCEIPEQVCSGEESVTGSLYINGRKMQEITCNPGSHSMVIGQNELSKISAGTQDWEIEIYMPTSFRPIDYGINEDQRSLSIRLNYVGEVR